MSTMMFPAAAIPALVSGPMLTTVTSARTLAGALAAAAGQSEENGVSFIDLHGAETHWSYRQLYANARRGAGALRALGLAPGSRVVLRLADPQQFTLALWSCLVGGYVVIPTADPGALPQDAATLQQQLATLQALEPSALILSGAQWQQVAGMRGQLDGLQLVLLSADSLLEGPELDDLPDSAGLAQEAVIFPTSGSSGTPKPVTQTEAAILAMCAGSTQMNRFEGCDVFLNWMPMEHVGSVVFLGVLPVVLQARQVHIAHGRVRGDVLAWLDLLTRYRASVAWVPNYVFNMVAKTLAQGARGAWDLSSLRFLVNAGESISLAFIQRFELQLRPFGLRADAVRPAFGMSETCSGITWSLGLHISRGRFVDLGGPIPGAAIRIVGPQGQLLNEGEIGTLHVRGGSVTQGYFKAGRDEKFLADGWFDTGDFGYIEVGRLFLTDREGDAIKIGGSVVHGHELEGEIEDLDGVLAGHTAVCCAERADGMTLAAFYCLDPQASPDEAIGARIEALLARVAPGLPVLAVALRPEELPRTSIGKIQRKVLRRRLQAARAPGG